jgi:hypothetical protein
MNADERGWTRVDVCGGAGDHSPGDWAPDVATFENVAEEEDFSFDLATEALQGPQEQAEAVVAEYQRRRARPRPGG